MLVGSIAGVFDHPFNEGWLPISHAGARHEIAMRVRGDGYLAPVAVGEMLYVMHIGVNDDQGWVFAQRVGSDDTERGWLPATAVGL